MLLKFFKRIINFYWEHLVTPYRYAKHLGVTIGEGCLIATRNFGTEGYLISIGNNVQLTKGVSIHTHGGSNAVRENIPSFDCFGKVVIDDWVYIGSYSQIMPGVTIGRGAIVAAGSIVTKSVPPHSVVGGNPARIICSTEEYIKRNQSYNLGCKGLSSLEKKKYLLSLDDNFFIKK